MEEAGLQTVMQVKGLAAERILYLPDFFQPYRLFIESNNLPYSRIDQLQNLSYLRGGRRFSNERSCHAVLRLKVFLRLYFPRNKDM